MRIILDANEFIFGLDPGTSGISSRRLTEIIADELLLLPEFRLFVPEVIRAEVQRNFPAQTKGDFYKYIESDPKIVYGSLFQVPPGLQARYRDLGLKEADATIAAFAEHVGADFLISENRHIYRDLDVDAFVTCNAETFLQMLESGEVWRIVEKRQAQ